MEEDIDPKVLELRRTLNPRHAKKMEKKAKIKAAKEAYKKLSREEKKAIGRRTHPWYIQILALIFILAFFALYGEEFGSIMAKFFAFIFRLEG